MCRTGKASPCVVFLFVLMLWFSVPGKEVVLLMQALNSLATPEEKLAALCKKYADLVSIFISALEDLSDLASVFSLECRMFPLFFYYFYCILDGRLIGPPCQMNKCDVIYLQHVFDKQFPIM